MATSFEILQSLGLIAANGMMIVFVVVYGKIFCKYAYAFSLTLPLYGTVFFYISFVGRSFLFKDKPLRWNPFVPVHEDYKYRETLGVLHRQSFFNGLVWSANYVCLLSANPYVPGLYQVVINESNLIMVFMVSMIFLGNMYRPPQWICFCIVLIGGALPLFESSESSGGVKVQWFLLYVVGAWAIGFANSITENVMRNHYIKTGPGEDDKRFIIPATQFLLLTNVYGILCVLALFWVNWMSEGAEFFSFWRNGMACLWTGHCPAEDSAKCDGRFKDGGGLVFGDATDATAIVSMWISSSFSFCSALLAAHLQRRRDVVYVTIAITLAPVLSMVLFLIHIEGVYDPPSSLAVVANIVTLIGGIGYKIVSKLQGKKQDPRETCLTKKFKFVAVTETELPASFTSPLANDSVTDA